MPKNTKKEEDPVEEEPEEEEEGEDDEEGEGGPTLRDLMTGNYVRNLNYNI
jgi:hypothetical protein